MLSLSQVIPPKALQHKAEVGDRFDFILFNLALASILLPVVPQTFFAVLLIARFVWHRYRRQQRLSFAHSSVERLWQELRSGFLLTATLFGVAMLVELGTSASSSVPIGSVSIIYLRLLAKTSLYGLMIIPAMLQIAGQHHHDLKNGAELVRVRWLVGFVIFYVLYMLGQRYYGWDWVHGMHAKLGPGEFAYGVYRAGGFMGHPLTLAYNAMVFSLLSFGHSLWLATQQRREAWSWLILSLLLLTVIGLSGSRVPSAITFVLMVGSGLALYGKRLVRNKAPWILALGACLVLGALAVALLDAKLGGRFYELWDSSRPLEERFDRVIFWKVHGHLAYQNPLFGVGLGAYQEHLLLAYNELGFADLQRKFNAHNIYLQYLADLGLFGFSILIILLSCLFRLARRVWSEQRHAGIMLLWLATVLGGMTQNHLRDTEFLFALWFCLSLALSWILTA